MASVGALQRITKITTISPSALLLLRYAKSMSYIAVAQAGLKLLTQVYSVKDSA